jgi:hypothetical protein
MKPKEPVPVTKTKSGISPSKEKTSFKDILRGN